MKSDWQYAFAAVVVFMLGWIAATLMRIEALLR